MRTEVDRLNAMVDDLFELSRIHAGALALTLSRMSVYDLVDDALAGAGPLARASGVRLVDGGVVPLPVRVDGKEMTRVLGNLLVNAIRATPADGTVAVSARHEAGRVVLAVEDGCGGIPEEDLRAGLRHRLARRCGTHPARGRQGGAGLGLAIVRGIVEAHEGRATVRNAAGGCRFEVALPAAEAPAEPPRLSVRAPGVPQRRAARRRAPPTGARPVALLGSGPSRRSDPGRPRRAPALLPAGRIGRSRTVPTGEKSRIRAASGTPAVMIHIAVRRPRAEPSAPPSSAPRGSVP